MERQKHTQDKCDQQRSVLSVNSPVLRGLDTEEFTAMITS